MSKSVSFYLQLLALCIYDWNWFPVVRLVALWILDGKCCQLFGLSASFDVRHCGCTRDGLRLDFSTARGVSSDLNFFFVLFRKTNSELINAFSYFSGQRCSSLKISLYSRYSNEMPPPIAILESGSRCHTFRIKSFFFPK